jgi:hypothetical protein
MFDMTDIRTSCKVRAYIFFHWLFNNAFNVEAL